MANTSSSRPRRSRAGLFLFLLVVGLAAWEVAARAGALSMPPSRFVGAAWTVARQAGDEDLARMAYRPLPYVMWGLKPGFTREQDERKLVRTSNSLGFRGQREVELPKPAGRYRIVVLGGSTTYDDAISDEETNVVQLEAMLRAARPGQDIEVVNAGVPSYTSAEDLPNLAFRCLDLQPDAVVIYQGINDFRTRNYRNFDAAYFHYRKVWDGSAQQQEFGEGEMRGGINTFIQHLPPVPNGKEVENIERSGTWAFRRNMTSMAGIAKAHGVRCILVTSIFDPNDPNTPAAFAAGMAENNEVVREVAAAQGTLLVDLAAAYPAGDYFVDPVHNNAAGAKEKARIIADGLLRDLFK